jgi:DNA-binding CsgD family transcriptional regulator
MNNIDLFESFKAFFREKAANLIAQANKNKIIIPIHMRPSFSGLLPHHEDVNNIKFLKERTKNLNQQLKMHFNTQLTSRELQTLSQLLRGRTALETSKKLNISPKTVEFYIDSVKAKFDCLTRAELFDKALESNLINLIIKL